MFPHSGPDDKITAYVSAPDRRADIHACFVLTLHTRRLNFIATAPWTTSGQTSLCLSNMSMASSEHGIDWLFQMKRVR